LEKKKVEKIRKEGEINMRKKKLWFNPKTPTGWKKTQKQTTRRSKLLASTDKRMSMHDRYVQAARKIQALCNVTEDKQTSTVARTDALYFFRKAKKRKE